MNKGITLLCIFVLFWVGQLWACGKPEADIPKPTENPAPISKPCADLVAPKVCGLPFPNAVFLKKDTSTKTGFRVDLSHAYQEGDFWKRVEAIKHDGFSPIGGIATTLPGGFSKASLPKHFDESLSPESSIQMVIADAKSKEYGKRLPFRVEVIDDEAEGQALLILTPLIRLPMHSRIAVILTDKVKKKDNSAHQQDPGMKTLFAPQPPSDAVQKQMWTYYRDLIWLVEKKLSLKRANILQMWDFHTRSKENATADLLEMVAHTKKWLEKNPPKPKVTKITKDKEVNIVEFTIPLPFWKPTKEGYIHRDKGGKLTPVKVGEIQGRMYLPLDVPKGQALHPIIYGHGLAGNARDNTKGFLKKFPWKEGPFAVVAIDWDLHGTRGGAGDVIRVAGKLQPLGFAATLLHSVVDSMVLSESLKHFKSPEQISHPLKPATLYMGASMGAIIGALISTVHPQLRTYALNVAGAGITNIIRSGEIIKLLGVAGQIQDSLGDKTLKGLSTELSIPMAMLVAQLGFDPGDPMVFAPYMREERFATAPKEKPNILIQQSIGDSVIPGFTSESLARSIPIPLLEPHITEVRGIQKMKAPLEGAPGSALAQFRLVKPGFDAHVKTHHDAYRVQTVNFFRAFLQKGKPYILFDCKGKNGTCDYLQ